MTKQDVRRKGPGAYPSKHILGMAYFEPRRGMQTRVVEDDREVYNAICDGYTTSAAILQKLGMCRKNGVRVQRSLGRLRQHHLAYFDHQQRKWRPLDLGTTSGTGQSLRAV